MKKNDAKHNWLYKAVFLSVLVHIFLLFGAGWIVSSQWFIRSNVAAEQEQTSKPLVFEFTEPEIVETPESAKIDEQVDKTNYLSDKNARAQNENSPRDLAVSNPYSDGSVDRPQLPEMPAQPTEQSPPPKPPEKIGKKAEVQPTRDPGSFTREFLTQSQQQTRAARGEIYRERSRNVSSRSPDMGAFSINTYAWDFAPYMIRLKRRIEKNIFPPPAFTYMGIISGRSVIKFRISPDGKLTNLEILSYNGHKSLLNTSVKAVEVSAPFEPLPDDFPEKYLEVTGRFDYITNR